MRRVRRLRPRTGQLELEVDLWRHHAVLFDRPEPLLTVEAEHRAHAVIETVIADLKTSAMAHLPSGAFAANGAWLALAALAHNLTRALATLAGHGLHHATTATIRRTVIAVPARLIRCPPPAPADAPALALAAGAGLVPPADRRHSAADLTGQPLTAHDPRNPGETGGPAGRPRPDPAAATNLTKQDHKRSIKPIPVDRG